MQAYLVLLLIGSLLTLIGASILRRCVVAKRLHDGGLDYFEGYSFNNWMCLVYFESKFNPLAVYENSQYGYTGFGLFQIRDTLLNPNLKDTIECVKKIVKGGEGMGAWTLSPRDGAAHIQGPCSVDPPWKPCHKDPRKCML